MKSYSSFITALLVLPLCGISLLPACEANANEHTGDALAADAHDDCHAPTSGALSPAAPDHVPPEDSNAVESLIWGYVESLFGLVPA